MPDHADAPAARCATPVCGQDFAPVLVVRRLRRPVEPRRRGVAAFGPSGSWSALGARRGDPPPVRADRPPAPGLFPETMALIGNRWSSAILGAAFLGAPGSRDFEQRLGAPPATIAGTAAHLLRLASSPQEPSPGRPDRHSYRLTKKGRAFFPSSP